MPAGPTMRSVFAPSVPAGDVQVIEMSDTAVNDVHALPPMVTDVALPLLNPVPAMVSAVAQAVRALDAGLLQDLKKTISENGESK